jgi:hypothetical protein
VSGVQAVLLPVGDDLYALPLSWVREVVAAPAATPLATAPALVLGLVNLRGHIVPLLDTAALLGLGSVASTPFAVVVVCPQGQIALAATGLPLRGELDCPTGPSELPGTAGHYQVGDRIVTVLDPAVLLTPERVGGHEARLDLATIGVD